VLFKLQNVLEIQDKNVAAMPLMQETNARRDVMLCGYRGALKAIIADDVTAESLSTCDNSVGSKHILAAETGNTYL